MIQALTQPRLRMFAGPNGSGKSTMKSVLKPELLGAYINPDEIEKILEKSDWLDLRSFGVACSKAELIDFYNQSTLLEKAEISNGKELAMHSDIKPLWFEKYILNKL